MKRQIASGLSVAEAAAEIRSVYGPTTSITKISERIVIVLWSCVDPECYNICTKIPMYKHAETSP